MSEQSILPEPEYLGSIQFSVFDDVIKSSSGKTISELKAIAKDVSGTNDKIKYTHALTAALCGTGFNVRDVSQVYPSYLTKAFGFGDDETIDSIEVFQSRPLEFQIHFKLSNGTVHQLNISGLGTLNECIAELKQMIACYDTVVDNGEGAFIEAIEALLQVSTQTGSGGHAAKQLLMSMATNGGWAVATYDLLRFDNQNICHAITALKYYMKTNKRWQDVIENGYEKSRRLELRSRYLYNQIRYFEVCKDQDVDIFECPTCGQKETQPSGPSWLDDGKPVPYCWGKNAAEEHDTVDMELVKRTWLEIIHDR